MSDGSARHPSRAGAPRGALRFDASGDHIKAKISAAEQMKSASRIAGLVIGHRDLEADAISVREHGKGHLGGEAPELFTASKERRK